MIKFSRINIIGRVLIMSEQMNERLGGGGAKLTGLPAEFKGIAGVGEVKPTLPQSVV